ncbi:hypothetical protein F4813DRAFT_367122 [Daldinia decipiens]|uniref:uncharacterized protein n=1 Tax=Daldinia decipiens TaxID=326647 RepID=UPI0020C3E205|nr:uncharacterized protein F4813DRAFT_367122 [Daldinia decipiens]KAI1655472.1 hypothetical protein F4813DRAFT_367122 [Daldinia decipiens]
MFFNIETQSKQLDAELKSKFSGYAKVALDLLSFDTGEEPDEERIRHLQRVFKRVGCDRYNPNNYISGTISADVLHASLKQSNLRPGDLKGRELPELRLPAGQQIRCLGGRHRILALRKYNRSASWWPIKLFVDLTPEACRLVSEGFANEAKYSDGEIVANILRYPEHSVDANQWWARLDKSKPRTLKKILSHPTLGPAFKKVLSIPGLRPGLLLAPWHKILNCVEEVIHYLGEIYRTWVYIVGSESDLRFVDKDAVMELQSRVPGVSYCDERHVEYEMRKETIFRGVTGMREREFILRNLKQVMRLIPSIHTLQQDFKYLRQCAYVMKKLIGDGIQAPITVRIMAQNSFRGNQGQPVNHEGRFLPSLKILYLHIMQDICQLSGQPPLKDSDKEPDYELLPNNAISWHTLAVRARELGFSSDEIIRLCHTDPDREMAIKALYEARPREKFDYGQNFEYIVASLVTAFRIVQPVESQKSPPGLTSHTGERVERRCGRVYSNTYDTDRHFITLENVTHEVQKDVDITSLFVRASVFHLFWGWESDDQSYVRGNLKGPSHNDKELDDIIEEDEVTIDEGSHNQVWKDVTIEENVEMDEAPIVPQQEVTRRKKPQQDNGQFIFGVKKNNMVGVNKRNTLRLHKAIAVADAQPKEQQSTSLALATPAPVPSGLMPQSESQVPPPKMVILVREKGDWDSIGEYPREHIVDKLKEAWNMREGYSLYTRDGRGIALDDCPTHSDWCVCLSKDGPGEGFPAEETL